MTVRFTVFFEDPFWVGLYERQDGGRYEVCKVTFGPEPKDYEVWAFYLENWRAFPFSPSVPAGDAGFAGRRNPKRAQREARRALEAPAIGTKAQQALKLQHDQGKEARQARTKEQRLAEQARHFALREEKRKQKHRGH